MWVMQANYGFGHGWEDECVEPSKAGALERLAEYVLSDTKESRMNFGVDMVSILLLIGGSAAILAVLQIWLDKAEEE